jgi:hypothetical protein
MARYGVSGAMTRTRTGIYGSLGLASMNFSRIQEKIRWKAVFPQ